MRKVGPPLLLALLLSACAAPLTPVAPATRLQTLQLEQQRLQAERLRLERALAEARSGAEQALFGEQLRRLELQQLQLRAQIAVLEASEPR